MMEEIKTGVNLNIPEKVGWSAKSRHFHRVNFKGRFYVAKCEAGTVLTTFGDMYEALNVRTVCPRCWKF